jgi:hypothetical protein
MYWATAPIDYALSLSAPRSFFEMGDGLIVGTRASVVFAAFLLALMALNWLTDS